MEHDANIFGMGIILKDYRMLYSKATYIKMFDPDVGRTWDVFSTRWGHQTTARNSAFVVVNIERNDLPMVWMITMNDIWDDTPWYLRWDDGMQDRNSWISRSLFQVLARKLVFAYPLVFSESWKTVLGIILGHYSHTKGKFEINLQSEIKTYAGPQYGQPGL